MHTLKKTKTLHGKPFSMYLSKEWASCNVMAEVNPLLQPSPVSFVSIEQIITPPFSNEQCIVVNPFWDKTLVQSLSTYISLMQARVFFFFFSLVAAAF